MSLKKEYPFSMYSFNFRFSERCIGSIWLPEAASVLFLEVYVEAGSG